MTRPTDDQVRRLADAYRLVESVFDELDPQSGRCPHCNCKTYNDFDQYNQRLALKAVLQRISKVINWGTPGSRGRLALDVPPETEDESP